MHRIVAVEGDRFVLPGRQQRLARRGPADRGRDARQAVPPGPPGRQGPATPIASPWSLALIVRASPSGCSATAAGSGRGARAPAPGVAARSLVRRRPSTLSAAPSPCRPARRPARSRSPRARSRSSPPAPAPSCSPCRRRETEARTQPVAQEGRFTYAGAAEAGTTYPTGAIATGDPIYTKLADALTVSFEHTVDAPGLDTVDGTVRLDLSVATADGWSAALGEQPRGRRAGRRGHRVGRDRPDARRRASSAGTTPRSAAAPARPASSSPRSST